MQVKFITTKGSERLGRSPFYVGLVQHERTMSRRETYEHCAERTGFKPVPAIQTHGDWHRMAMPNHSLRTEL